MAKQTDTDRWNRGVKRGSGSGVGGYSSDKTFKSGDDIGKDTGGKVDSATPSGKSYGSFHYPHTKDG